MSLLTDAGIGAAILTIVTGMFGFTKSQVNKKQDKEMCEQMRSSMNDKLERGEKRFDKIDDQLKEQTKAITNLDQTMTNFDKSFALLTQELRLKNKVNGG